MTEPERQAQLRDATDKFIRKVAESVGKALNEDISPAVTKTVEDVVGGAIASALRPENKRLASSFIDSVTREHHHRVHAVDRDRHAQRPRPRDEQGHRRGPRSRP